MNTSIDAFVRDWMPRYDELVAFEPEEFATALEWAEQAISGRAHIQDPTTRRITVEEDNGRLVDYAFTDRPEARVIIAMSERYLPHDRGKYYSAVMRMGALMDLVHMGGMEPWIRRIPGMDDKVEVADSVIAAAAVVRLNHRLQFPVREFMRKVRQIEAGESRSSSSE